MMPVRATLVNVVAPPRNELPPTGAVNFGSPPPVYPLMTEDAQTNMRCCAGSYELGGQLAPPQMPGATIVASFPANGVKIRPSLTSVAPSGAIPLACGTTASPRGNGWVAAVACFGSCGTGFSSIPTRGLPFLRSGVDPPRAF